MHHFLVAFLLLAPFQLFAQPLPFTQRFYGNITVEYLVTPRFGANYTHTAKGLVTGTFWVAKLHGESVLITAAHNLGRGPNFVPAPLARAKPVSVGCEPLLGLLGFTAAEIGIPRGDSDWVALRPKEPAATTRSQGIQLGDAPPQTGETVTVIGFPDTAHEQRTARTITAVSPNSEFVVFNEPLEPGYSGGVVLNAKNQAVGLVVSTDKKQSTALLLSSDKITSLQWKPFEQIRHRRFDP